MLIEIKSITEFELLDILALILNTIFAAAFVARVILGISLSLSLLIG